MCNCYNAGDTTLYNDCAYTINNSAYTRNLTRLARTAYDYDYDYSYGCGCNSCCNCCHCCDCYY